MSLSELVFATPLGNLNPPGHTLPSDHVYFYWVDPDHRTPNDMALMRAVYAPAGGYAFDISGPGIPNTDHRVMVRVTNTFSYYLSHILLDSIIMQGVTIRPGQRLGTTSPYSYAVDLGIINTETTLTGFVNPARYPYQTLHAEAPYKYFVQPLRDSLYGFVRRMGPEKDGKIDYDMPGRLVGAWFLKGLPLGDASASVDAGPRHLAFVYDMANPTSPRISIGGILSMRGLYGIMQPAQDFSAITPSSGKIGYKLISPFDFPNISVGLMIVQMTSADTIKVETFPGLNAATAEFSSGAATYTR
jgi:hypothetical protein